TPSLSQSLFFIVVARRDAPISRYFGLSADGLAGPDEEAAAVNRPRDWRRRSHYGLAHHHMVDGRKARPAGRCSSSTTGTPVHAGPVFSKGSFSKSSSV